MPAHEDWLEIAQEDLRAARVLLRNDVFRAATYYCQQAAEKSVKAYLVFNRQVIIRTHDLLYLHKCCVLFDSEFGQVREGLEYLNQFASKFRYPFEDEVPDLVDTQNALKDAQEVVLFVHKKTMF